MRLTDLSETAAESLRQAGAFASDLVSPTVRLGVTGLSRSGKTVLITALVHNLVAGGRLPFFRAVAEGRIKRAWLEPQPDDDVPRFEIERHLASLAATPPAWPAGTRRISQLRVTLEYEPAGLWRHVTGRRRLHLDIVDYPGEWLLDLPLLGQSFAQWSAGALALARQPERATQARQVLAFLAGLDPAAKEDEAVALAGAGLFRAYLEACRREASAFAGLTPGRFLMPGDLEGSPALTFLPLEVPPDGTPSPRGSLAAMMERRYEAYRQHVVRPFFRDHFSRLDRQIVLVDTLSALSEGPAAVADLERALTDVLACFRAGANTLLSAMLARRIDRILFAATKADHLHHSSHDRLEGLLGRLVGGAITRAQLTGARVKVIALAGVRATREAELAERGGQALPCIIGTPLPGEEVDGRRFDGLTEAAVFPGDLPESLADLPARGAMRVVGFRPPVLRTSAAEPRPPFPHVRLDRALDFLIGDRLT